MEATSLSFHSSIRPSAWSQTSGWVTHAVEFWNVFFARCQAAYAAAWEIPGFLFHPPTRRKTRAAAGDAARDGTWWRINPGAARDAAASPVPLGDFPRVPAVAFCSEIISVITPRPLGLSCKPFRTGWGPGSEPTRYSTRKEIAMAVQGCIQIWHFGGPSEKPEQKEQVSSCGFPE